MKTTSTYNNSHTWTEEKYFDDFETTNSGEPLLAPTPMLATQNIIDSNMLLGLIAGKKILPNKKSTKTTTETVDSSGSSSINNSSSEAFETTEEFSEIEATADTATTIDDKGNVASKLNVTNDYHFRDKNAAVNSNVSQQFYYSSPTTYVGGNNVASTYAANNNLAPTLTTKQHENIEYSTKQNPAAAAAVTATATTLFNTAATDSSSNLDNMSSMTEYVFSTRSSNIHNKNNRHKISNNKEITQLWFANNNSSASSNNSNRNFSNKYKNTFHHTKVNRSKLHSKAAAAATAAAKLAATNIPTTIAASEATYISSDALEMLFSHLRKQNVANDNINFQHKNLNNDNDKNENNNKLFDFVSSNTNDLTEKVATTSTAAAASTSTTTTLLTTLPTTKKYLRKSTQKLLATPFHQITYVRNNAGDIDIDNIDNISVYPDILDLDVVTSDSSSNSSASGEYNESGQSNISSNSRMTIVSGYLPTSATATLPESIRIAKIKINKERKRMSRQRHIGGGGSMA